MPFQSSEQQGRPGILFYLFGLVLLYAILALGMPVAQAALVHRQLRDVFLILTAALGLAGGISWGSITKARPDSLRTADRVLVTVAYLFPAWVLLQCIPLPSALVALLSPARAELTRGIEPLLGHQSFSSLSVTPAATMWHFLLICAYCVLFFAAREFAVRMRRGAWLVAVPVLAGAGLECLLALLQISGGSESPLKGTFAIRNHLAGFLEMAMPLALACAFDSFGLDRSRDDSRRADPAVAVACAVLAFASLAVAFLTLSRGGFLGIVASGLVFAIFGISRRVPMSRRLMIVAGISLTLILLLVATTPMALVSRLSEHDSEGRTEIWREALGLIRAYPLFGVGAGGFTSAFLRFKAIDARFVVDYAHNDYVQGLAELGLGGFLLVATLIGLSVIRSARYASGLNSGVQRETANSDAPQPATGGLRWLALGCLGSLVGILVHSVVDFNLYVPANAACLAWICGMAAGLTPSFRKAQRTMEAPGPPFSRRREGG